MFELSIEFIINFTSAKLEIFIGYLSVSSSTTSELHSYHLSLFFRNYWNKLHSLSICNPISQQQVVNSINLPSFVLQDNVDEFMNLPENSEGVEKVLRSLDEQHGKYKVMEYSLATKRRRLRQQLPDLARSLEMIEKLKVQTTDMETQFLLSDQVFIKVNHII